MGNETQRQWSEADLKTLSRLDVVQRGQHLFLSRRVYDPVREDDVLSGRVQGNTGDYRVRLHVNGQFWSCSCPKIAGLRVDRAEHPADNDACKHVVALGYAWLLTPQLFRASAEAKRPSP